METLQISRKATKRENESSVLVAADTSRRQVLGKKFMQSLDDHVYRDLVKFAGQRGVTIQGLIRAVIIPEWIISQDQPVPNYKQIALSSSGTERRERSEFSTAAKGSLIVQR